MSQRRDLRAAVLQVVSGLLHGQFVAQAGLEAPQGQAVRLLLGLQTLFGHGKTGLAGAKIEVIQRDLGEQGDERIVQILSGGLEIRVGGLDGTPDAAEEIDLPGGIQTRGKEVAGRRSPRFRAAAAAGDGAAGVQRRIEIGPAQRPGGRAPRGCAPRPFSGPGFGPPRVRSAGRAPGR